MPGWFDPLVKTPGRRGVGRLFSGWGGDTQVIWAEEAEREVAAVKQRVLSLFDLVCIGVGGTVGSGVFVLTAEIATQQAGAAVSLCWLLAALTCTLSGLSYMEMCGRVPSGGMPVSVHSAGSRRSALHPPLACTCRPERGCAMRVRRPVASPPIFKGGTNVEGADGDGGGLRLSTQPRGGRGRMAQGRATRTATPRSGSFPRCWQPHSSRSNTGCARQPPPPLPVPTDP